MPTTEQTLRRVERPPGQPYITSLSLPTAVSYKTRWNSVGSRLDAFSLGFVLYTSKAVGAKLPGPSVIKGPRGRYEAMCAESAGLIAFSTQCALAFNTAPLAQFAYKRTEMSDRGDTKV